MRRKPVRRSSWTLSGGVLGTLALLATLLMVAPVAGGAVSATTPWALMKTPYLFGTNTADALDGVSCPTPTFCIAVGLTGSSTSNSPAKPLVEDWTGGATSSWKVMATTGLPTTATSLVRISCSSSAYCMAIGGANGASFAALWNGSVWTPTPSFSSSGGTLWSLSCFTTDCMVVGTVLSNGTTPDAMVAEHWDGQSWTSTSLDGSPGSLGGVSCFSTTQCLAVGPAHGPATRAPTFAAYFDNGVWTSEPPLNPYPTQEGNYLNAVDCERASTPTICVADGDGGTNDPIAETWNATTNAWTVIPPNVDTGELNAVSCPTAMWCVATTGNGARPSAQAWNGSTWTLMNTKAADGSSLQITQWFGGLSCPSTTFCVAVGDKSGYLGYQPQVADWGTVP